MATLGAGIGTAVLAFSFLDGTLLAGLPYPETGRLAWVCSGTMRLPFDSLEYVNPKELAAWQRHARFVSQGAVYRASEAPVEGRDFLPQEMAGADGAVAIVTDSLSGGS